MDRLVTAIKLEPSVKLDGPLVKEWHARGNHAWLVNDSVTSTLLLAQKLHLLVSYINEKFARSRFERVTTRGLYEAATLVDLAPSECKQPHKLRYRISRCVLDDAHVVFESVRTEGASHAILLTEAR